MKIQQLLPAALGALALMTFSQAHAQGIAADAAPVQASADAAIELPLDAQERAAYLSWAAERVDMWEGRVVEFSDELSEETATSGGLDNAQLGEAWQELSLAWTEFYTADEAEWDEAALELQEALNEMEQAWEQRNRDPQYNPLGAAPPAEEPDYWAINLATRMNG